MVTTLQLVAYWYRRKTSHELNSGADLGGTFLGLKPPPPPPPPPPQMLTVPLIICSAIVLPGVQMLHSNEHGSNTG